MEACDPLVSGPMSNGDPVSKSSASERKRDLGLFWVPFLLGILAYLRTLRSGWVWDDIVYIVQNPAIHQLDGLSLTLRKGFGWVPGYNEAANSTLLYYRPVVVAANALQWILSNGQAWAFHLGNVLAHALTAAVLGVLASALGMSRRTALFVASVFAIHPANAEAVAWISARTDLFAACFGLISLLVIMRAGNAANLGPASAPGSARAPGVITGLLAGLALFLAMGSKESAIPSIVPAALLLTWCLPRRGALGVGAALIGASALYFGLRVLSLAGHAFGAGGRHEHAELGTRLLQSGALYLIHLGRFVFPWPSSTEPPPPVTAEHLSIPLAVVGLVLLIGSLALTAWTIRAALVKREPRMMAQAVGLLVFLGALVPVLQWVPTGDLYGERFLYLPAAGLLIAIGVAIDGWVSKGVRAPILLAILAVPCVLLLKARLPEWDDEISLFSASVRVRPESARANSVLGAALMNAGRMAESEPYLRRGLELDPDDTTKHAQVGSLLIKTGKVDEGVKELEAAYDGGLRSITVLTNLGVGRIYQGRGEDATAVLREALALQPDNLNLKEVLAVARDKAGDHEDAAARFMEVVRLDPERKSAYLRLIDLYRVGLHEPAQARVWIERFLSRFPDAPEAETVRAIRSPGDSAAVGPTAR